MSDLDRYIRMLPRSFVRTMRNYWLLSLDLRDRLRGDRDDSIPPRSLHYVGNGDFKTVGQLFLNNFVTLCDLKQNESILDIGCGTGRMAIPLLGYLNEYGSYIGFDVSEKAIKWCVDNLGSKNNHFKFHYADIYNNEYNPKGKISASEYIFPCDDESIDFAFALSLFTHLREKEMDHYLSEIRRVLKPSGRAMLSFFIIDETSSEFMGESGSHFNFNIKLPDCHTIDAKTPERAIAHSNERVMQSISDAKLQLTSPVSYGGWSGRPSTFGYQDTVIVERASE